MNNLDKSYQLLLQDIIDNGVRKSDRTGTGTTSVFGRQIRHKMSDGFPLLTTKKMPFKLIEAELIWFLRGDTNIKFLLDNDCHIWDGDAYKHYENKITKIFGDAPYFTQKEFINEIKTDNDFAKMWGELGPIYGRQWRRWGGLQDLADDDTPIYLDQISNLIKDLKTNPDSRRLMVSAWNVGELNQMVLPPCHYGFQMYTRELSGEERWDLLKERVGGKIFESMVADIVPFGGGLSEELQSYNIPRRAISLMWNQRSVDTFLGLPFNIASYGLLLEIIAQSVNMVSEELIGNLGDVHLYSNHIEQAKEQIGRDPFELPKLNINTEFWPTEGGECGIGPINATAVFNGFHNENFCKCLLEEDIQLYDYQSHPTIKAPLSN
jgi:thymidylate synthase